MAEGPGTARPPVAEADLVVLRRRARLLAAPVLGHQPVHATPVVVLAVADRRYAVGADRVVEVLPPAHTTTLPRREHQLAGARVRRGDLLAVADPGRVSGGRDLVAEPDDCFVVVLDGAEPLGLLAHAVTTSVADDVLGDVVGSGGVVRGVTADGVVVLDVDVLLGDPRFRVVPATPVGQPPR